MYKLVEKCDFIIPYLNPDDPQHDWYVQTGTSGSFQLSYGFLKPIIVHSKFAVHHGFNDENSFVYASNEELLSKMINAIEQNEQEYATMQSKLKIVADSIYETSYNNLKSLIQNKGISHDK